MKHLVLIVVFIATCINLKGAYVYGRYTGDGNSTQAISGLGITPEVVLVKSAGGGTAWVATSSMQTGYAKLLTGTNPTQTGLVSSLDADGFTVASSSNSNTSGVDYFYVAWDANSVAVSSFTPSPDTYSSSSSYANGSKVEYLGSYYQAKSWVNAGQTPASHPGKWASITLNNVVSGTNINVGYRPIMVWTFGEGVEWYDVGPGQFVLDGANSGSSSHFNAGTSLPPDEEIVSDLTALGFQMNTPANPGVDNGVVKGVEYHYVTFEGTTGVSETSTYAGTSVDNEKITTSFQPGFLMVKDFAGGQNAWFKTSVMQGDTSYKFTDAYSSISIKTFESDGFTLGYNGEVNLNPNTFEYVAFADVSVLPVEFLGFKAVKTERGNQIYWQTGLEQNNDYFDVQRSTDGKNFKTIGRVYGAGNSTYLINYNFLDEQPSEVNYYRLKQVDFDGAYVFSTVVLLKNESSKGQVEVYYSPNNQAVKFVNSYDKNEQVIYTIYNIEGKVIKKGELNEAVSSVDFDRYSNGKYFVTTSSKYGVKTTVFVK